MPTTSIFILIIKTGTNISSCLSIVKPALVLFICIIGVRHKRTMLCSLVRRAHLVYSNSATRCVVFYMKPAHLPKMLCALIYGLCDPTEVPMHNCQPGTGCDSARTPSEFLLSFKQNRSARDEFLTHALENGKSKQKRLRFLYVCCEYI